MNQLMLTNKFSDECEKAGLAVSTQSLENAAVMQLAMERMVFNTIALSHATD